MRYAIIRHKDGETAVQNGLELHKTLHELPDQPPVTVNYNTGFFEVYTIENRHVKLKTNSFIEDSDSWILSFPL
jgi:hypothetical protein